MTVVHSMRCSSLVVKLGGSAITNKSEKYSLRGDVLDSVSDALAKYWREGGRLAIVHGGGSFGHYEVERILSKKDVLDPQDAAEIQFAMLRLAVEVAGRLIARGVPVTVYPPHSLCRSRQVEQCNLEPVIVSMNLGLVPLLYGDAVPHEDGVAIISGDDLAAAMASLVGSGCLVYVISEKGVLDEHRRTMPLVTSIDQVPEFESEGYDVTGGIRRKIEKALEASKNRDLTVLVTDYKGLISLLLEGRDPREVGTLVRGESEE